MPARSSRRSCEDHPALARHRAGGAGVDQHPAAGTRRTMGTFSSCDTRRCSPRPGRRCRACGLDSSSVGSSELDQAAPTSQGDDVLAIWVGRGEPERRSATPYSRRRKRWSGGRRSLAGHIEEVLLLSSVNTHRECSIGADEAIGHLRASEPACERPACSRALARPRPRDLVAGRPREPPRRRSDSRGISRGEGDCTGPSSTTGTSSCRPRNETPSRPPATTGMSGPQ